MRISTLSITLAVAAVAALVAPAAGQARSSIELSNIGRGSVIGKSGASHDFRRYSSGLGSLGGRGRSGGSSVLSSSLSSGDLGALRRSSSSGGGRFDSGSSRSMLNRPALTRGADYSSPISSLPSGMSNTGYQGIQKAAAADPLFGTKAYLEAMGTTAEGVVKRSSEPIASLVPAAPSKYRDQLADGERAFRAANYLRALDMFELANVYNGDDPESLLSIFHTRVAMSEYGSAGFVLRKVLRNFPELPLVPLRPKAFYGDEADYREHIHELQKHVQQSPFDPSGHLITAYYRWYEGDVDGTTRSLQGAHRAAGKVKDDTGKQTLEAIDTFWKAMVASGTVSGELEPAEKPTTQEASPETDAAEESAG
ncbi:MAG: hypothetical protein ACLFV7_05680 [Phycisphaerae bacterium]